MHFLNQIKTSHKLIFILFLFILTFVSMMLVFNYTQKISNESHLAKESFEEIHHLVFGVGKGVYKARSWEENFLMLNDFKHVENFKKTLSSLYVKLDNLSARVKDVEQLSALKKVRFTLDRYARAFNSVVELRLRNGLDHESGLQGELRNAVHKAEVVIKEQGEVFLMFSMLSQRRHEKDFIMRHDKKYVKKIVKESQRFLILLDSSDLTDENKKNIKLLMTTYQNLFYKLVAGIVEIDKRSAELQQAVDAIFPVLNMLEKRTELLSNEVEKYYKVKNHRASVAYYSVFLIMGVISILLMLLVIRSVNRSTRHLHKALAAIASGNAVLSDRLEVEGKDEMAEIAQLFNRFVGSLQEMLGEVSGFARHLTDTAIAAQISKDETTSAIQTQVNEIEKIAGEIDLMTASIEQVAGNAQSASDSANEADNNATTGQQIVTQVIHSIEQLASNVESAGESVERLDEYSRDIDSVVAMINSIAEQTNLLALNAAIEAARAGEAGRGFAVVADEVRTLSKRTTNSTKEIKKTIANLQLGTSEAVGVMNQSREQAVISVELAQQAGESLSAIAHSVGSIVTLNAGMSDSASQQSVSARQISQNIHGINDATNQLAATAQQTMSDSGDISQTASMLQNLSARFVKTGDDMPGASTTEADSSDVELF